jgi:hypothetical protein
MLAIEAIRIAAMLSRRLTPPSWLKLSIKAITTLLFIPPAQFKPIQATVAGEIAYNPAAMRNSPKYVTLGTLLYLTLAMMITNPVAAIAFGMMTDSARALKRSAIHLDTQTKRRRRCTAVQSWPGL